MAVTVNVVARNHNTIRYRITQDGAAGTSVDRTVAQMRTDLAFFGSPLDVLLARAEIGAVALAADIILGNGAIGAPVVPPADHAVTKVLRQLTAIDNTLAVGVFGPPNVLRFTTRNTNATDWIVEVRIDHTLIQ